MNGTERSATELLRAQAAGESAEAITESYLSAISRRDERINAYLLVDAESAREQARDIDRRRKSGLPVGRLGGVPIAVKDVLCVKGQPTTAGSRILANYRPPYDAHVISELKRADAVVIGKTNMDEFAMGSSTENSGFFPTRNPWDVTRTPGGSSGGSAAAVAAGETPLALGTDTGGSIRQPASFCGVVGLKPSYGRVSRFGLVAFASSLDQIGPIAWTTTDAALLLEVIAGHDARDSTSVNRPVPAYTQNLDQPIQPLRIGVAREYFGSGLDSKVESAIRSALKEFEKLGAVVKDVSLPHSKYAIAAYYLVATAEASSNLSRYDGVHFGHRAAAFNGLFDMNARSREEGFGAEVKRRIMLGTFALSSGYKDAYYTKALQIRRLIKNDFDAVFQDCDVIMGPTAPTPAFRLNEKSDDPLAMYLSDIYTISCNLAGITGVSVPCGFTQSGLPIGLQIQADAYEEEKLLRVARMYERVTDWHTRRPSF